MSTPKEHYDKCCVVLASANGDMGKVFKDAYDKHMVTAESKMLEQLVAPNKRFYAKEARARRERAPGRLDADMEKILQKIKSNFRVHLIAVRRHAQPHARHAHTPRTCTRHTRTHTPHAVAGTFAVSPHSTPT